MPAKEVWGLDIGQHAIRLARVQRAGHEVVLADYSITPIGVSPEDPEHGDRVVDVLEELVSETRFGRKPVYVSVPGQATFFRDFPLPAISSTKLKEIVSYEARQQIPYPLEEVLWDFHEQVKDDDASELSIALVCVRRDIVEDLLSILDSFKLNIAGIQAGPVALANFIEYDQPPEKTTLVLDSGASATDFLMLNQGSFWLRSIGVAGADVTKALMDKFNMPFDEAEKLKSQMGESKQADRVFQVITPVLRNITGEVQRSMGYYKSLYRGVRIEEVIGTGGTFHLPNVDQFMADDLGVPVRLIEEPDSIVLGDEIDEDEFAKDRFVLGTAIGLGLQGVGEAHININLLPPEVQRRHMVKAKVPWVLTALVMLIAMTAVGIYSAQQRASQWDGILDKMREVIGANGVETSTRNAYNSVVSKHAEAEDRNLALARVALNRGDLMLGTGVFMDTIEELNGRRAREVEMSNEEDMLRDRFLRSEEIEQGLATALEDGRENEEKLREYLEDQVKRRIARISKRRRRIFVENMKVMAQTELWYERVEAIPGQEGEKVTLLSPDEAKDLLLNEAEKQKLREKPLQVVRISAKAFSVSRDVELADVTSLGRVFSEVPRIWQAHVVRGDFGENNLPVLAYQFSQKEETESAAESMSSNQSKGPEWTVYKQPIINFTVDLVLLPQRTFSIEEVEDITTDNDLTSGRANKVSVETSGEANGGAGESGTPEAEPQPDDNRRRRRR